MIPSRTQSLHRLAAVGLLLVADSAPELRVLRVIPTEAVAPPPAVTITFDRPVAGSLAGGGADPRCGQRAGGRGGAPVFWMVDDVPHAPGRWGLRPGRHRFRAISPSGDSAGVTVRVE
ncbi:MAG: hypothetical protein H0T50_14840 [Gemmatimonadales bacterium]|nr:hypothetical protein [Gemmatimonadales bacterium]